MEEQGDVFIGRRQKRTCWKIVRISVSSVTAASAPDISPTHVGSNTRCRVSMLQSNTLPPLLCIGFSLSSFVALSPRSLSLQVRSDLSSLPWWCLHLAVIVFSFLSIFFLLRSVLNQCEDAIKSLNNMDINGTAWLHMPIQILFLTSAA